MSEMPSKENREDIAHRLRKDGFDKRTAERLAEDSVRRAETAYERRLREKK